MELVSDSNLHCDWEKRRFLKTKAKKGSKATFIMAGKDYSSTVFGNITVFFNAHMAWVWADNGGATLEDIWTWDDVKEFVRTNFDPAFPYQFEQCISLCDYGSETVDASILEKFGLTEFKADIEARVADLVYLGEETDTEV